MVDTTTATIDTQYAYNSHWSATASATFGDSKFLGESGRIVLTGATPAVFDFDGTMLVPAFPAVLGKGKRLFGDGSSARTWNLVKTVSSPKGAVITSYERAGEVKTGSFLTKK